VSLPISGDSASITAALLAVAGVLGRFLPRALLALGRLEQLLSDIRDDTALTREAIAPQKRSVRVHKLAPPRKEKEANA
jgi:hypothetical protein